MEIDKKKYKQKEVVEIISELKIEYESKLAEQRGRVVDLTKENSELKAKLDKLKQKESLIASTLEKAQKTATDIEEKAILKYSVEMERLRNFSQKWEEYFIALKEKYPVYKPVMDAVSVKDRINRLISGFDPKKALNKADESLSQSYAFNPKGKIAEYIAATEDNGFNMEDVLNPGDLKLEDLCKELGLMDANE